MKHKLVKLAAILGSWACTVLLLLFTSPANLPSAVLIAPFILLYISIFVTVKELMHLLRGGDQNKIVGMKASRPRLIAALIAGFPVLLLILQSIGQLSTWDILTVVALFIVAYFYIVKSSVIFPGR